MFWMLEESGHPGSLDGAQGGKSIFGIQFGSTPSRGNTGLNSYPAYLEAEY
jgi:hypothetical protein